MAGLFGLAAVVPGAPGASAAHRQQPDFRTGVTIVEMAVTVLDKEGTPRTDLRAHDFEVLENGVPELIEHVRLVVGI